MAGNEILVVRREILFKDGDFQGFIPFEERDFTSIIDKNSEYVERSDELERNTDYVQIASYVWLVNPKSRKVFLYRRAPAKGEYTDVRQMNRYSGGVGGHIDKDAEENSKNPVYDAMVRELHEEVIMKDYPVPEVIGYIRDHSDVYNKVHMGLVAIGKTTEEVRPASGMSTGKFCSEHEVEELMADSKNDFDRWTRISWLLVKEYLEKL
jgi:predicted NUDIX family phosphoesterase